MCAATVSLPRTAISDGKYLFVADAGNDRVLVYKSIPTDSGAPADIILGQQADYLNQASDSAIPDRVAAADSFKTPTDLAWDGTNLYVCDGFNRRVVVYSPGDYALPLTAVRNAPSPLVYAAGAVTFSGNPQKDDEVTIKIGQQEVVDEEGDVITTDYKYKLTATDTFETVIDQFVSLINTQDGGNPYVVATPFKETSSIILTARDAGDLGNKVTLETDVTPDAATTIATATGTALTGGQDAAIVAPYSMVAILGDSLSDQTTEVQDLTKPLPKELGGVRFYVDGIQVPMVYVSPTKIVAQLPRELTGSKTGSGILYSQRNDGRTTVSTPVAIRVQEYNPSIYVDPGNQPAPGVAFHYSSSATATIDFSGTITPGNVARISIRGREYVYTIQAGDTNNSVRDAFILLINDLDPEVEAFPAFVFTRLRLRARVEGPEGNGIPLTARCDSSDTSTAGDGSLILSTYNSVTCCANQAGAEVTEGNPAEPGETIVVLASGLGLVKPEEANATIVNGMPYDGPEQNEALEFVSSLAGGKTANVLFSGLRRGLVGVYEVHLELNPDLPTNSKTPLTIAQGFNVSNIVLIPVVNTRPGTQ
jgi:hypothetical protein